jgi:hypothetical protein
MTELELQAQVADYIRLQYPDVIFHSDFGSGIKLTMGQAIKQKRLNGGRRSWPDMFLAEQSVRHEDVSDHAIGEWNYAGLFIELKREGTRIFKKDGTLVADEHIREQFDTLADLRQHGYAAEFAIGFEGAKKLIDDYMEGRYAHAD